MGFRQVSGIEWECDNCERKQMHPNIVGPDDQPIAPEGWLTGTARQSSGNRTSKPLEVDWTACKAACVAPAIREGLRALTEAG